MICSVRQSLPGRFSSLRVSVQRCVKSNLLTFLELKLCKNSMSFVLLHANEMNVKAKSVNGHIFNYHERRREVYNIGLSHVSDLNRTLLCQLLDRIVDLGSSKYPSYIRSYFL